MNDTRQPETHEEQDVNVRRVTMAGIGLLITVLITLGIMVVLMGFLLGDEREQVLADPPTPLPAAVPGLQAAPAQEWLSFQATQEAHLATYGWVDEAGGVAHIPIDRAMALLLEHGLPTPAPTAVSTATVTPAPTAEANE
ncbi:MAG: hypothetical protein IPM53_10665 [Anaerolineaceae bacterium]|nr:hypothetical protein [Anaerolineaceae bacterium]